VPLEDVCYFEALDKRSLLCLKDGRIDRCNRMLQYFGSTLPPDFVRIHRSFIVDTREIRGLSTRSNGRYHATISNGDVLPVSRRAFRALKDRIGGIGS
jgi:two-component system, LytTR family, response regulator LytT